MMRLGFIVLAAAALAVAVIAAAASGEPPELRGTIDLAGLWPPAIAAEKLLLMLGLAALLMVVLGAVLGVVYGLGWLAHRVLRRFWRIAGVAGLAVVWPGFALAGDSTVNVPVGAWADAVLAFAGDHLAALVLAVVAALCRKLPAEAVTFLRMMRAEQLLERAIGAGINQVRGATAGRVLTLDLGSAVTAKAVQYAIDHGPGSLVDWMGGREGIAEKIWARLDLEPVADASAPDFVRIARGAVS